MKHLLYIIAAVLLLSGCKKEVVYHGMPELDVRDGMIVVRNTTDESITSLGAISVKHAGIHYTRRNVIAHIVPGDSILVSLSDFTGEDPSKPYGQRTVRFPKGEMPEYAISIGKYLDRQPCPISWPRKKNE